MSHTPLVAVSATSSPSDGYERVRLNDAYARSLAAAGLVPIIVPPIADPAFAEAIMKSVAGLLLSGGEDVSPGLYGAAPHPATGAAHADRDACEVNLVRLARERGIPTLAICRGIQIANVAFGGTLIQDIPTEVGNALDHDAEAARNIRVHDVRIEKQSGVARSLSSDSVRTNSFHHQAVADVAPGFRVVAHSPDGVIEAMEPTERWWMAGVQWHPEELTATAEDWDRSLFASFARAVKG